ncbi:Prion-like-(Q/N-rich)-domain-bearing protein [Caenorhabditis elegans]|uniref:Prion-like-(Q/N-rich)-domain-bearing protein n=3 Tax=Caenorhabditis elegans TaxID=6239 RepID=A0A8S4QCE3_CAEEL|nr:Prion-like-(Q/N-rich)-domain-bearing protein [Caenorhabditis elegans]CAH2171891.1 Prion-like-(Q/N-rich)-domain-bearing protein [Caenorhabditis elegans]
MSRPNQIVTQFPALDHEPRGQGPPPSYRNSAATEDSWSTMSGSGPNQAMSGQRRNSWNNLVQVGGDPIVQKQPPPRPAAPMSTTFSVNSRTSSLMGLQQPTVFSTQFSAQGQALPAQKVYSNDPRLVSIPRPAGTIPSLGSMPPSRSGSIITGPNPSPPSSQKRKNKNKESKSSLNKPKRNRLQELKNFCKKPSIMGCCLCLLLILIIAIIIIIILTQVLPSPKNATFTWMAPQSLTNGQNSSSRIEMTSKKERIRFQTAGSPPIKGNYINYYDFNSNQVVVIDQSLSANGKNLYCFVLPLDRSSMPNPGDVRKAAKNSVLKHQQSDGWQQVWSWLPSPLQQTNSGQSMFNPPIPECNGSRIIQLQQTSDQRNRRCTDCYDFCLPQFGIMKNASENNEEYLNIKQQDCFYLFVPEWRTYAQANTIEQNQQDFENYYRNRQHMQVSYGSNGPNDSRWIPLSGMPNRMMNATGAFVGQVGNAIGDLRNNVYGMVTGQNQNPQGAQQQQQYGNGNGQSPFQNTQYPNQNQNPSVAQMQQLQQQNIQHQMQQSRQPSGYHPAVNGVVNLNGVNGNNGNTEYNVQPYQGTGNQQTQNGQSISPEMRRQAPYSFNSNINSGYTNQQPGVSSGNSNTNSNNMNGFGAQPSYRTSQFGFNNNDPRNQVGGLNGNGLGNSVNSEHQISVSAHTNAPRIGTVLNEFGNPVNVNPSQSSQQNLQQQQLMNQMNQQIPQYAGPVVNPNYISTSGGLALENRDADGFSHRLQQLMGTSSNYRPDVEPVNYNVPTYSQPNRPDALSRQGRIFKRLLLDTV